MTTTMAMATMMRSVAAAAVVAVTVTAIATLGQRSEECALQKRQLQSMRALACAECRMRSREMDDVQQRAQPLRWLCHPAGVSLQCG